MSEGSCGLVEASLRQHGRSGRTILEADAFARRREGALRGCRLRVYYHDAAHDYQSQREALRLVEPNLVDDALVSVDDPDWPEVARALRSYRRIWRRARLLLEVAGKDRGQPWWSEGVQVRRWAGRQPAGKGSR